MTIKDSLTLDNGDLVKMADRTNDEELGAMQNKKDIKMAEVSARQTLVSGEVGKNNKEFTKQFVEYVNTALDSINQQIKQQTEIALRAVLIDSTSETAKNVHKYDATAMKNAAQALTKELGALISSNKDIKDLLNKEALATKIEEAFKNSSGTTKNGPGR